MVKGNNRIVIALRHIVVDLKTMGKLISLSLGGIGQNLIATTSWVGLVRIISVFGSEAVAGYTIAIRIILFVLLPSWGISNAASTLVGQNLGAKKPDRAEKAVWFTGKVNLILLGLVGLILVSIPEFFIRLFIDDPVVIKFGAEGLRIISYGFPAYGLGMVIINSFNGAGDTTTPLKINYQHSGLSKFHWLILWQYS
ncbi:MAG: MATE family efflux transporter [Ignavibacteriales bacterium]|nr:MATE family efflux transporter [Ignavibacteriales bacterium]